MGWLRIKCLILVSTTHIRHWQAVWWVPFLFRLHSDYVPYLWLTIYTYMKQGLAHVAQVSLLPLLSSVYQIKYKDVIMFHIIRTWHLYVILYNCLFCRSCLLYLWQGFSGLKKKRRQLHELFILSLSKFLDRQILFASYNFNVYWGLSIFCYL